MGSVEQPGGSWALMASVRLYMAVAVVGDIDPGGCMGKCETGSVQQEV